MVEEMFEKVISGGQTGADKGSLKGAKKCGILTGGTAPKGYRTENGSDISLKTIYNLEEHSSSNYPPRTQKNVMSADGTILFGKNSGGTRLTKSFCIKHNKPFLTISKHDIDHIEPLKLAARIADWAEEFNIKIVNCAGNRESNCSGIEKSVSNIMSKMIEVSSI